MSEHKSQLRPDRERTGHQDERIVEAAETRKGVIVMPVESAPIDIQNLAPSGPPAPQQTKSADK